MPTSEPPISGAVNLQVPLEVNVLDLERTSLSTVMLEILAVVPLVRVNTVWTSLLPTGEYCMVKVSPAFSTRFVTEYLPEEFTVIVTVFGAGVVEPPPDPVLPVEPPVPVLAGGVEVFVDPAVAGVVVPPQLLTLVTGALFPDAADFAFRTGALEATVGACVATAVGFSIISISW